jgi:hypothetical protein
MCQAYGVNESLSSHVYNPLSKAGVDADAPVGVQVETGVGVFLDTAADTSTLVLDLTTAGGTGFAVVELLASAASPEAFTYHVELAEDHTLALDDKGGIVVINPDGSWIQPIAPPWAFDSEGNQVPVRYELAGNRLVMHVKHRGVTDVSYPIVADPCWSCIKKAAIGVVKTAAGVPAGRAAVAAGAVAVLTYNPVPAAWVVPLVRASVSLTTSGIRDLQDAGNEK